MNSNKSDLAFGRFLKFWRSLRGVSQESLATDLGCSQRHIARVETGRGHPSEKLVDDIATALRLGQRDWNHLRISAGYVHHDQDDDIAQHKYKRLRKTLLKTLAKLDPIPAVITDVRADIRMVNRGWVAFFKPVLGDANEDVDSSLWEFIFRHVVAGNENATAGIVMCLQQQACFTGLDEDQALVNRLIRFDQVPHDWADRAASFEPSSTYELSLVIGEKTHRTAIFSSAISSQGPTAYLSEPYLLLHTFYPDVSERELSRSLSENLTHPLLEY